jgi:carboxymethylenebutenolidase
MFDRVQKGFDVGYTPEDIAKGREVRGKVTNDMALKDAEAAIKLASSAGKVGIVGYCWGGLVSWLCAGKTAGLACAVPYYGGGILDNAELAPKVPLMGHFGEKDAHIPADGVRKLAAKYAQHQIFIYAADHGFNCDQRGSYDAPAAKQARGRTLDFFRKHVG